MKKQTAVILLLAVVLIAVAVAAVVWTYSRTVVLGEKYPFMDRETVSVQVEAWPLKTDTPAIAGGEFLGILRDARVTKGIKTNQGPDVGLLLHLFDEGTSYSVEVGRDGFISVARTDDLEGTRTYWKDKDGGLFDKLYQCYLENGGEELLN